MRHRCLLGLVAVGVLLTGCSPVPGAPPRAPATSTSVASSTHPATVPTSAFVTKPSPLTSAAPHRPDAVELATAGIRVQLVPSRIVAGELTIPESSAQAGVFWPSGEQGVGVAVVVGHVSWRGHPGAFARLPRVRTGDVVLVRLDGELTRWRVVEVTVHPRGRLPHKVFSAGGDPALALVTCTGPVVKDQFTRNLLVWAEPA